VQCKLSTEPHSATRKSCFPLRALASLLLAPERRHITDPKAQECADFSCFSLNTLAPK
jgi:hypothetical protein